MVAKSRSTTRRLLVTSDARSPWGAAAQQPSPTSPLDDPAPSQRGWRHRDVGLGILAALEEEPGMGAFAPVATTPPRCARLEFSLLTCGSRCTTSFRIAHFLAFCHLCGNSLPLHGKDIFMYREKGFCSPDCRLEQIVFDDYQAKVKRAMPQKPKDAASSAGRPVFFIGILAAW